MNFSKIQVKDTNSAQFEILTVFGLLFALLHQTPISKRYSKDHKPNQFHN